MSNLVLSVIRSFVDAALIIFTCLMLIACNPKEVEPTNIFSPESGSNLIASPVEVMILTPNAKDICYTTDSSVPTLVNGICTIGKLVTNRKVVLTGCGAQKISIAWEEYDPVIKGKLRYISKAKYTISTLECTPLLDDDKDGYFDGLDNCPHIPNPTQSDTDRDGIGDACDARPLDLDNDGLDDGADNCPAIANPKQEDLDANGVGDVCDSDDDNDGVADVRDNCPMISNPDQINSDGDGFGNTCDVDDDNDGINDDVDNCSLISNANQTDYDNDKRGDVCDPDDDNDGVNDNVDNCPLEANAKQTDADKDGVGDVCDTDDDGDGIVDGVDNCPQHANPNQEDSDNDKVGDVCDTLTDNDRDGVADNVDNCPLIANADQADFDGDKKGDACDPAAFHVLRLRSNQQCFIADGYDDVGTALCNSSNLNRQWLMTHLGDGKFQFKNSGRNECLFPYVVFTTYYLGVTTCKSTDTKQQWRLLLTGIEAAHPLQIQGVSTGLCVSATGAIGVLRDCAALTPENRSVGIYPDGNFSAVPFKP